MTMQKSKHPTIKQVAASALNRIDAILARWLPNGNQHGHEYKALNPTRHDSKKGSFSVNTSNGRWADFATGDKGGDLVALVAYLENCKQSEASKLLIEFLGLSEGVSQETEKEKPQIPDRPITPIPARVDSLPAAHYRHGKIVKAWPYHNEKGELLFYQTR